MLLAPSLSSLWRSGALLRLTFVHGFSRLTLLNWTREGTGGGSNNLVYYLRLLAKPLGILGKQLDQIVVQS